MKTTLSLTAAALLVVALAAPAGAANVPTPLLPQYTPPATALPATNGDLVTPSGADLRLPVADEGGFGNYPNARDLHLVMYRTTDARGAAIPATALVIRSKGTLHTYPAGSVRPLVAYAPGNQGMADHCASSYVARTGAWYEIPPVNGILGKGFDVVVPDYPGLGINDGRLHAVANNRANGQATLDALRAARLAMPNFRTAAGQADGSPAPNQLGIWGYSEGGGAAAWAAAHLNSYAHADVRTRVAGVATGGVTADLRVIGQVADGEDQVSRPATRLDGTTLPGRFPIPGQTIDVWGGLAANPYAALILMALGSVEDVYEPTNSQFDLSYRLTSNGLNWTGQVKQKCLIDGLAVASGLHVAHFVRNVDGTAAYPYPTTVTPTAYNPLLNSVWIQNFRQNNPATGTPPVPVFLYHGSKDISVAYPQAVELRERWCAAGANVHWRRYLNQEHVQTWGNWAAPLGWLQQQLYAQAGLPNSTGTYGNNCAEPNLT